MKIISPVVCVVFLAWLVVGMFPTSAVAAEAKANEIKPVKQWTGRIDKDLQKEAPARGYVASEKALAKLWEAWKIKDQMPKVDFDKELVLVTTSQSSGVGIEAVVDDKGNLTVMNITTSDRKPDFAYLITLIKRDGVKTIAGKAIEKD